MAANRNRIELLAGQVLFREGEAPTTGFLLEQGEIAVSIRIGGEPIVLSRLRAGDILGEMGVFDGAPRSATATALTDCVLLTIDRNQISERLDKADPILRALLEGQVRRYRGAIRAIRETAAQRAGAGAGGARSESTEPGTQVEASAGEKFRLEAHLREALAARELDVRYQPILHVASGRVAGYEALVRWNHPERGPISPLQFVGLAEESELIVPLGEYVFDTACEAVQRLQGRRHAVDGRVPFVAVNVSARQLEHPGLIERVVERVQAARIPPGSLKVEITESQALDLGLVRALIERCHRHGIGVALDDFGTGYSHLAQMHELSFDTLKVDQAFSRSMLGNPRTMAVLEAILRMARALGAEVVVEGVETQQMLEALRTLGCDYAQGYLVGRPQTLEELLAGS
jgi:EAL domain-containing protein (putative c-di-GMP-specific phosphodiesterase class I)